MKRRQTADSALARQLRGQAGGPARLSMLFSLAVPVLRAAMLVALALFTGALVMDEGAVMAPLAAAAGLGLLLALAHYGAGRYASVAERSVAAAVIGGYRRFLSRAPVAAAQRYRPGDLVSRLSRHPAALAEALVSVANARTAMAVLPFVIAAMIALFSPAAALLLILSLPVMVAFFILVGSLTRKRAEAQEEALSQLSAAFSERIRCLPTILASHAAAREAGRLGTALEEHRRRSLDVLKVAFLNAAVLDFFSALSVAMLAVFFGLGHLGLADVPGFAGLPLAHSLAVLMLAPEFFNPLRRYAELYHAAAEGKAALAAYVPVAAAATARDYREEGDGISWRGLTLPHVGAVADGDLPGRGLAGRGLAVIAGPSGSGKTTLLRALAGIEPPLSGRVTRPAGVRQAWSSAEGYVSASESAVLSADAANPVFAGDGAIARQAGRPETLSGGQRMRLVLAAALAGEADILFIDEPTAKLDEPTAARIRETLTWHARRRLLIVASHDPQLIAASDFCLSLEEREREAVR